MSNARLPSGHYIDYRREPIFTTWRQVDDHAQEPMILRRAWDDHNDRIYIDHIEWVNDNSGDAFASGDTLDIREQRDVTTNNMNAGKKLITYTLPSTPAYSYSFDVKRWVNGVHVKTMTGGQLRVYTTPGPAISHKI